MVPMELIWGMFGKLTGEVMLSREAVGAPSLEAFKARMDGALGSLIWWGQTDCGRGVGTGWALRSLPTQGILWFCDSMMILWNLRADSVVRAVPMALCCGSGLPQHHCQVAVCFHLDHDNLLLCLSPVTFFSSPLLNFWRHSWGWF